MIQNEIVDVRFGTYMTDLRRVGPQTGLRGETFATDVALEGPIFGTLDLSVVVS